MLTERHYICAMGNVNSGKAWLATTLGDEPRANSLVKTAQAERLLLSNGRGRNSAPLRLTDYAAFLCMALMTDGPTKAPETVDLLWRLPLSLVTLDPGDGTPRSNEPHVIADHPDLERLMARYFADNAELRAGVLPNVIGLVTSLFSHRAIASDFMPFDRVELLEAGGERCVMLTLHGPDYRAGWAEGEDAHMLQLVFGGVHPGGPGALLTRRTLFGDALNALAELARRVD